VTETEKIKQRFRAVGGLLNERALRLWAGAEALTLGRGGITKVARVTRLARTTVARGMRELRQPSPLPPERVRQPGGGRRAATQVDPTLKGDLEDLLAPVTRGDPQRPLRWTSKSVRHLARALQRQGHRISYRTVARLLKDMGYSLQANRKSDEGRHHPDRDAQFQYLNDRVQTQLRAGQPAISVDTKKKELVGPFKNGGRTWRPKGRPEKVRVYDFKIKALGRAVPYGVYDLGRNQGWVNVGMSHDTAGFAAATIGRWWRKLGRRAYPHAKALLITADCGESNNPRVRLWRWKLQTLANATGLTLHVHHFPPGTSKWNKIEHRLFSFITQNWRGRPLVSYAVIVNLIAQTTTQTGLRVYCELDAAEYPLKEKVRPEDLRQVSLRPHAFHPEWNYTITPASATI
jgi:hypothetical protein